MDAILGMIVLLTGACARTGAGERELFADNGFESGFSAWKSLDMSGTLELALDAKTKKSGKQALRITRGAGEKVDFVKQFAELASGDGRVQFSMQYRVDREGELVVQVFFFDAAGTEVGPFVDVARSHDTKKKWLRAEQELEVPAGATSFGLNLWAVEAGTIWVDDVSAVHVASEHEEREAGPPALANGGFEINLGSWEALPVGSGTARAVHDTKRMSAGKASLRLEREGARLHPRDEWRATITGSLRHERVVTLRYACAVGEGARASVCLQAMTETGALLATTVSEITRPTPDFSPGALTLELPAGAHHLAITLAIGGRGSVWFDALELELP